MRCNWPQLQEMPEYVVEDYAMVMEAEARRAKRKAEVDDGQHG